MEVRPAATILAPADTVVQPGVVVMLEVEPGAGDMGAPPGTAATL